MKVREFKRVWGFPWDYTYLLQIEQCKIKEMSAYFKKYNFIKSTWNFVNY